MIQIFSLMMSKEKKECSSRTKVDRLDLSFFWGNAACKAAGSAKGGDKIREKNEIWEELGLLIEQILVMPKPGITCRRALTYVEVNIHDEDSSSDRTLFLTT